jgi:CRP-like cAMP-binding protein
LAKKKKWEEAKKLLRSALVLARIHKSSGFGELSTLTGVKRAATIRTDANSGVTEIVVLPKQALLDCLKSRRQDGVEGAAPSEAMDFMRQSGLANRISPKDLVNVAGSMIRRTMMRGEILYYRGEEVNDYFYTYLPLFTHLHPFITHKYTNIYKKNYIY